MKSNEVLRAVFEEHGFKMVAAESGFSVSCLYKWCEPDGGAAAGTINPLERVWRLYYITGDVRLLRWLCGQADGFFMPNPGLPGRAEMLSPSALVEEMAEVLREVARLGGNRGLPSAEVPVLRQAWERLKSDMEGYVRMCERGCLCALLSAGCWLTLME